jgi:hypothetical protein
MKVLIMTYKKNGKWNESFHISKKRFQQLGYTVKPIEGYNLKQHPEIKPSQVVYLNLRDKVIPYLKNKKYGDGILVAEDDSYVADFLTPSFLLKKLKKNNYRESIIKIGYQKVLKHPKSGYPRGYFCVGNQLIWFPKNQMKKLEKELHTSNAQHLNGFLSKNMNLDIKLLDQLEQKKNKYVLELEHVSATTGKTRKGLKINKNNFLKNKVRSKKLK